MSDRHASDPEAAARRAGACPPPSADVEWNAGDLGCGELVLELRTRVAAMRPGQVLRLIAHDPGAPQDMPAWCRMTGHTLVSQQHPVYLIRRKEH